MTRIDSIAASLDRVGRQLVKFSNGQTMRLYRQSLEDFALYPGKELSEEDLAALEAHAGATSAKMRAVRIVAASSVSKGDLKNRLIQKGEDPRQAEEAVSWMEELKLVDDEATARQIVARCIAKGYGPARAKQALYEKRIPKQYWDQALGDYPDQTEAIIKFLRARLSQPGDPKQTRRAVDALLRRGHSYSQVRKALDWLGADGGEIPEDDG